MSAEFKVGDLVWHGDTYYVTTLASNQGYQLIATGAQLEALRTGEAKIVTQPEKPEAKTQQAPEAGLTTRQLEIDQDGGTAIADAALDEHVQHAADCPICGPTIAGDFCGAPAAADVEGGES
jgi:hypothetical protein